MEREQQRRVVEAVILASPEPIAAARVAALIPRCNPSQVRTLVKELNEEYAEQRRAFEIWEVAGGYQVRSLPEFAPYIKQIQETRALRLSNAALETLAIVAYRQPVTRAEVEQIRGVDGGAVLRGLLERNLVRIAGHREVPGRPIIYATTRRFLEVFGLVRLGDLPTLRDLAQLAPDGEVGAGPGGLVAGEDDEGVLTETSEGDADAGEDDEGVLTETSEGDADAMAEASEAADVVPEAGDAPAAGAGDERLESAPAAPLVPPSSPTH